MPTSQPNLLFILSDDQGPWALGCAGNHELRTPHLDALAATGTRFENFYCTSPVCSPARATIATGRLPSQHGVHDWLRAGNSLSEPEREQAIRYLAGETTWSERLSQAGYTCGLSGKWHLGDAHRAQAGYTYWHAHARGGGNYYGAPMVANETAVREEPRYVTEVITAGALAFLEAHGQQQPFCLSVHYTAPHSPWERAQHPPDLYDSYFEKCPFKSLPDEPAHPWLSALQGFFAGRRREWLAGYFAAITAMDAGIGRLLAWLQAHGLREETLVVFTSDNGMNMGHHGICGKGNSTSPLNLYESSVKVPCIVSHPSRVPAGQVRHELCSHYDWRPTLLDWLGVADEPDDTRPGRSFATLLRGEPEGAEGRVVVYDEYGPSRMIRRGHRKYIHRYPDGPHEFYDLAADPDERHNLAGEPTCATALAELRGELLDWFARYADPAMDGARLPVCGKGQINWAGEADAFPPNYEGLHRPARA
ncbi:MAG: sulfatase-like hydrolase/transferase [Armatimonadetes bacterium]|nr:sulfatase-like hydrolase/transferase [Armatimonadota bacterium]